MPGSWRNIRTAEEANPMPAHPPVEDYPFHQNRQELVVTRDNEVVGRLPCERVELPGGGAWTSHHIGAAVGRASDGTLFAAVHGGGTVLFSSTDDGRTWTDPAASLPRREGIGCFTVLADDTFLLAAADPDNTYVRFYRSGDRGKAWQEAGAIACAPFDRLHLDGNLLQLSDGTVLLPVQWVRWEAGALLPFSVCAQYVMRSSDGGITWEGGPDPGFWGTLLANHLTYTGTGPAARIPGPGGTFPGVWETGIAELAGGTVLGAFRYSGPPQPWHRDLAESWHGAAEPDAHGRLFRIILRGSSPDQGLTWEGLGPIASADGKTLLIHGECNGELVGLPDGRALLVHQRRYPGTQSQIIGRVSEDGGWTWRPEEYRVNAGFGYPGTLAMADGTLVTVVGQVLANPAGGDPVTGFDTVAIRWRLLDQ